ncbi:MAG: BlaI/MecI/CopY family transcriptional regulator [Clostridia bacterium]|nr:BlaI/MecI/CopY family transcriptional regulator [Clostridia bacterium]
MDDLRLGVVEARFADIVWAHAPIASGELVRLCGQELEWKKSTTYTVLRKLCDRGIFQNEGGVVSALLTRDAFYAAQSRRFVEQTFDGSLPAFLAAFTGGRALTDKEIAEIQQLIDAHKEG